MITLKKKYGKNIILITGILGGIGSIFGVLSYYKPSPESRTTDNRGTYIEKNDGQVTINNNSLSNPKTIILEFIENRDIHLGDNVYPERWGDNYNPLNIAIYPQDTRGLIYYDKEKEVFLSGPNDGQTLIGQTFVDYYSKIVDKVDFDSYKLISSFQGQTEFPDALKTIIENGNEDAYVRIDPGTILYLDTLSTGNFYSRYAAVAFVNVVNFGMEIMREDIKPEDINSIEFVVECYHGGKREFQEENFELLLNGNNYDLWTTPDVRRRKENVSTPINIDDIDFDGVNWAAIFVKYWNEDKPKYYSKRRNIIVGTAHFRDVGITNAYFKIRTK